MPDLGPGFDDRFQRRYWNDFVDLQTHSEYLFLYQVDSEKWDRRLSVFLACTSSGSIGAWAIWDQFGFVWGVLIAASQVLNAVKEFLPFKSRLKRIALVNPDIRELLIQAERDWFWVQGGHLSDEEIHERTIDIKSRVSKAVQTHFSESPLPHRPKLMEEAEKNTRIRFADY